MRLFFTTVAFMAAFQVSAYTFQQDSIGIETIDGKTYIIHEVADKETLYAVSRRYDVSIYKIISSNPPAEFGLEVGQRLKIPYEKKETAKVEETKNQASTLLPDVVKTDGNKYHKVEPGQTLFSISQMYDVEISDLQKWNNLTGTNLDIGQSLIVNKAKNAVTNISKIAEQKAIPSEGKGTHVVQPSETLYSISRKYNVTIEDVKKWNDLISNEISIGQELIVSSGVVIRKEVIEEKKETMVTNAIDTTVSEVPLGERPVHKRPDEQTNFEEIAESGVAELIEGTENTRKYLALHRTAKVGTIMRVKNEMNDQEVFVRVLGKLPNTGSNKNVLIKISKSAYDRLGAIDKRFRVIVSYIP